MDKCHVLHIGNYNLQITHSKMFNSSVNKEKDLGVIVISDLKPSIQGTEVVKTANKLVDFIGRTFNF